MGGFILCNKDGQPIKTISVLHFKHLVREKIIDFPQLTSLEIQERSNLHPAFVLIALLQATWFVAQCVFRFTNDSPTVPVITQLEAITVSIVIANWCIFLFSWKKPLDVRPILIKANVNIPSLSDCAQRSRGITVTEAFKREQNITQSFERRFQLEYPQLQSTSLSKSILRLSLTVLSILLWPLRTIFEVLCQLFPTFMITSHKRTEFSEGTLKIPLFYVDTTVVLHVLSLLLASVLGMGVSIVSFLFLQRSSSTLPFYSEGAKHVWRIASVTSTSFSAVTLGFITLANFVRGVLQVVLVLIWYCIFITGFVPFFLARVVLLVSSVICLRSVPGDLFVGQSWIPHFS